MQGQTTIRIVFIFQIQVKFFFQVSLSGCSFPDPPFAPAHLPPFRLPLSSRLTGGN